MLQMQGPGLSIPSLVSCYDDQSCMTSTPSRPQYCSPNPQNGYHSGRVLQEMMYQNEVNFPGFIADHRGNQGLQSTWSPPWGPRQNVPYLSHPHPGDPYQYAYAGDMGDYQDDNSAYAQKRKRARTAFSAEQLKRLEKRFLANHYIVGEERQKVAKDLDLSEAQVKVWFQNRRTKFKRDQELERLGKKKKRKGEHHIRKWQITTKHFYPELDNDNRIHNQM